MKRAALGSIAALFLSCTTVNADSQTLTVLQWNVFHGGRGTDSRVDVSRQVNWIAAKHPDIVSLNEVTALQAEEYRQRLDAATGDRWYSYHVAAQADGTGNQILSRHPFVSTDVYRMRVNGEFRRAIAQATVDIGVTRLNIFSTHLDNSSPVIRQAQVRELLSFISHFPEPWILAGDLNAPPDTPEIQVLGDRLLDTWSEAVDRQRAVAYPGNPPDRDTRTRGKRLDYILHSPGLSTVQAEIPDQRDWSAADRLRPVVQTGTTDDLAVRPSDHNFVFAVLAVKSSIREPR
jgi:endonuclease/exonuclease/phosphatase family metal-dependent hydrolase